MAVDMFLKFTPDLKGESVDSKHKEEIDVLSWSFGASQSATTHMGGGGGAGKVNVQDISITKYMDKASPQLFFSCASGKHYDSVLLTCRKAGGDNKVDYLKYKLTEVLVSSYQTGASGGEDRLTENISLNFAKIEIEYTPQDAKGAAAGVAKAGWDIAKNIKV